MDSLRPQKLAPDDALSSSEIINFIELAMEKAVLKFLSANSQHGLATASTLQPRLIRMKDAPKYLGMTKNKFKADVRPSLKFVSIGKRGIAFDKLDLDTWVEQKKRCDGRPNDRSNTWDVNAYRDSTRVEAPGTLIKPSSEEEFTKILKQLRLRRQRNT